ECRERLDPSLDVVCPVIPMRKRAMLANALRFRGLLRQWRPDMLVTCNWGSIEWAVGNLLPVARHMHIVDGFGPEEVSGCELQRRVLMRRMVLGRSIVTVPSRNLQRIATEVWRLAAHRVHYIPNGIDLQRFGATQSSKSAEAPLVIGTVAALRKEKNLPRLLRAVSSLSIPARLIIVGDGPCRAELEGLANALGMNERVQFVGRVDNPVPLYADFDVFALSSDTEQMPLSLIEAMASGLPVAATNVGDVRNMVAESNARFIGGLDEASLVRSLTQLLGDVRLRQRVGSANREKAHRDFDQGAMFQAYGALLRGAPLPPSA
ncbi:MAG: glycosyltransferase family 4 protein, partial [Acetobacteraceae bacterium]|nr:glycosyltransferase family 4 protein [Acetobacteraceae bacterium]